MYVDGGWPQKYIKLDTCHEDLKWLFRWCFLDEAISLSLRWHNPISEMTKPISDMPKPISEMRKAPLRYLRVMPSKQTHPKSHFEIHWKSPNRQAQAKHKWGANVRRCFCLEAAEMAKIVKTYEKHMKVIEKNTKINQKALKQNIVSGIFWKMSLSGQGTS